MKTISQVIAEVSKTMKAEDLNMHSKASIRRVVRRILRADGVSSPSEEMVAPVVDGVWMEEL